MTSAVRADFTDLHATLVEIAGLTAPTEIDGRPFLSSLMGTAATGAALAAARPYQVWFSPDRNQAAVLEGRWKGVWMRDTLRVFDLAADPGERNDLAAREPMVAARLDAIRRREDRRVTHPLPPR